MSVQKNFFIRTLSKDEIDKVKKERLEKMKLKQKNNRRSDPKVSTEKILDVQHHEVIIDNIETEDGRMIPLENMKYYVIHDKQHEQGIDGRFFVSSKTSSSRCFNENLFVFQFNMQDTWFIEKKTEEKMDSKHSPDKWVLKWKSIQEVVGDKYNVVFVLVRNHDCKKIADDVVRRHDNCIIIERSKLEQALSPNI